MSERPTLVIVDDERNVVDSLRRTLRHENYEVVTFVSPTEALGYLEENEVDVLISDIDMPEMTGLELIATTRRKWPHIARILLTGDSSLDSAVTAINDGAVHKYLTKPWRSAELRECIREIIENLGAQRLEASRGRAVLEARAYQETLEKEFAGFAHVGREDGAYLLNDMRVWERLKAMGEAAQTFKALQWQPAIEGRTEDLRKP